MLNRLLIVAASVAAVVTVSAAAPANAPQTTLLTCQGSSGKATAFRRFLQHLVSDTSVRASAVRSRVGLTTTLDTAQVTLVSIDSVCTRVTQVVDSVARTSPPSSESMIVMQFGSRYGAYDQTVAEGSGRTMIRILDSTFTYHNTIAW